MKKYLLYFSLTYVLLFVFSNTIAQVSYNASYQANAGNPGGLYNLANDAPGTAGWTTCGLAGSLAANAWSPAITLPFAFDFYGTPVTQFKVSANGLLTFDATVTGTPPNVNGNLPDASLPNNTICAMWDEFTSAPPLGANDIVYYRVFGTAPNRQVWVYWYSYEIGNPSLSFNYWAAVLEETTNKVYVIDTYGNTTPLLSTTVGVQLNSTTATQFGVNNIPQAGNGTGLADNDVWTFLPQTPCTGTPAPGNTLSSVAQSCGGVNFTLSLSNSNLGSGVTYQWQISTDGTTYVDITGATSSTYVTQQTSTNYYQCVTTCSNGGATATSVPLLINAGTYAQCLCTPVSTSQASWVSAYSTSSGVSNFSYTAGAGTAGGYNNQFGNFTASNYVGATTNIAMTAGGPTCGFAVWIDWNNNATFETTERVYNTTGYVTTTNGSFLVPIGTPNGSYRMRVVTDFNSSNPTNPCATISRGEFVDFTFNVVDAPSCLPPTALATSSLTTTGVTVSWTAPTPLPDNGYQYIVSTTSGSPAAGATPTGTVAAGVTSLVLTGLTPNTTYYVFVASDCGGTISSWSNSATFYTGYCVPAPTSVDGTGITNVTFGTINNTTGAEPGNYGDYSAQSNDVAQTTTATVLITYSTGFTYDTKIWVDWNDDLDFNDVGEEVYVGTSLATNPTTLTATFTVPLTAPLGAHRMRIGGQDAGPAVPCYTGSYGTLEDYTLNVTPAPSCLSPTALANSAVTTSGATITWTAPSPAPDNGYQYFVSTSATSPVVGATPTGTTAAGVTTVTLTGLTANTTYYVFAASDCGTGVSPWSSATSFFTGYCVPGPISVDGNGITNVTFGTINNTTGAEPGNYGDYSAQSNDVPQTTTATVLITYSTGYTYDTKIWVDWNDDLDFTDVGEEVYVGTSLATNPTTLTASFTVPLTAPLGAHRMRIGGQDTGPAVPCYTGSWGSYEDYTLNVIPAPNCLSPTALSNTAVNTSGATISWTAPSPAPDNGYQYFVSTTAGSPAVGATPTGTVAAGTTSVVVTGLNANTTYYVFVASVCGAEVSPWSSSTSFYTGYCVPNSGSGCQFGDLIANVTLNTLSNNSGTVCVAAYNDYTENPGLTTTLLPSSTYNCVIGTGAYAQSFAVWIDYNDDLIFDASERVGYTINPVAANSTATFPIVLSCTPPAGNHVMRVRSAWDVELAGINVTPCGTQSYGEVEDYLITIAPAPTCPAPGQLSLVSTTTTTANLTWNMGCSSATNFDFEYGPTGFVQGTGTLVSNVSATINAGVGSYTLTGLTPNTAYSIYFRANCGSGDVSPWSLSTNAVSNCAPISLSNPGNQTVCNSFTLPTITEATLSGNAGLVLQYRTQPNGAGTIITSSSITSTQTVYIYASAGSCTAEQSFVVTVNNSTSGVATVNACNSYSWIDGNTYTSSTNTPTFTLTNAAGCDSVVTLNLTINNSTTGTAVITACDSYTWIDGNTYTSSTNTPTFTLTSVAGCDSVVTLNLTINGSTTGTDIQTACDSYTWIDGNTYTSSTNTPTFTLTNTSGCDSIVTLNLTINTSSTGTDVQTACDSYTWIDGNTYTSSTNSPTFTLTNASGCDSIVTLNLTINTSSTGTDVQTACDSYTWIDGNTYTSSTNTPTFTLTNASGCDSIVTLNLSINSTSSTTTQAACGSYTWNGETYTQSGTYTFTATNANGCDSIATLVLTINAFPTASASGNGAVLTSSTGSTYQWIDCATNTAIQGATSQTYNASENGSYAVIVTNASGCSDTSNCVIVETIGLNEYSKLNVLVNPNPSTGLFNIDFELPTEALLIVLDASGRVIQSSIITDDTILDLTSAVTGIYYLQINSNDFKKVIRIVKN